MPPEDPKNAGEKTGQEGKPQAAGSPKRAENPFSPEVWSKAMAEMELGEEKPAKPTPEKVAANDEECPGCPKKGETKTAEPAKPPAPFRILKVDGKEVPVMSQEELDALAQKGLSSDRRFQDAAKLRKETDESVSKIAGPLDEIVKHIKAGKKILLTDEEEEEKPPLGEEEEETIEDPAARKKIDALEQELKTTREELGDYRNDKQNRLAIAAAQALEKMYSDARQEFPFEDIVDDESKQNLAVPIIAGYVGFLKTKEEVLSKNDPDYEMKPPQEIIKEAVRTFSKLQAKFKGNSGGVPAKIDVESLRKSHPEIVEAIAKDAVSAYIESKSASPKIIRPAEGAASERGPRKKGDIKTVDQGIEEAFNDPEVKAGIEEIGSKSPRLIGLPIT